MTSFKIDRIKKERRQSESERTEGLFQSIDWIIDKYPTIPIQPKTRVDDYSMIMQFPSKSLVTDEMYSYIQSALMINGWEISDWNENEVIVHDFFTMIDDGVPLPTNGRTPRYDEIGKSKKLSKSHRFNVGKSATKDERYIKGGRVVDWVVGDNGTLTEFKVLDGESYSVTWYFDEQLLNDVENLDELPYDSAEYEIDFGVTKSARPPKRSFNDMVKAQRVPTIEEDKALHDFANHLGWAVMGELLTLRERIERFTPPTHPARYMRMKESFEKFEDEYIKCVDYYNSMVMYIHH